jgi:hypothetical protein
MPTGTLLPPVRPLPAAAAELRSAVRGFLAAERAAGGFVPAAVAAGSPTVRDRRAARRQPNRSTTVSAPAPSRSSLRPTTSMCVRQCRSAPSASRASTSSTSLR